ncbi:MAG: TSUP family transporter [Bacteroidetes bacterium]|nr:TSUP family transporter [Bacteroidota bacterium]
MSTETHTENISSQNKQHEDTGNNLFPVFLKLENLRLLIIGGGNVGLEKLSAVLQNAPATHIRLVATNISEEIKTLARDYDNVTLIERPYEIDDLNDTDVIISAVDNKETSIKIWKDAKKANKLINVADKPELCDFYLSSIVKKGNLKIAISTNGKSPTIAKRIKETLNDAMPEEIDEVLHNMESIRKSINGDFSEKVNKLNDITKILAAKQIVLEEPDMPAQKRWQQIVKWCLLAFVFMIIGHAILSFVPFEKVFDGIRSIPQYVDTKTFLLMLLTGFLAQMVDGSLGLGYGTISTTFLLATGVNPAIVSSRVHSARVFSSGVSGYSHHRFGNINKKLFKTLVIPGVIGAILGATLAYFGQKSATYVRIPLSFYTIYLGYYIIRKAFNKNKRSAKVKRAGWLASTGGFLDAFAGGGWGALVTSTLISKRRNPRYVIGSVCLAEFFVVLSSAITFFILLKHIPVFDVLGLVAGGILAAPIAARLAGKLPMKTMFLLVGSVVMLTSITTLWKAVSILLH